MNPRPAYGEDTSAALSLINTRVSGTSGVFDRLADEDSFAGWLMSQPVRSTSFPVHARFARFQQLRADTRALLTAYQQHQALPEGALERINQTAAEPIRPVLGADRTLLFEPINEASLEAKIARDLILLIASPDGTRLHTCSAEDCDRMFIRDHARTIWCSAACGSRMRARRHAARRKNEPTRRTAPH